MIPLVERAVVGAILERRRAAIAAAWYRAIAPTGFAARPAAEVRRTLDALTQQVLTLLVSERVAPAQAEAIGAALVNLHFVQPATLAQTLGVFTHAVVDGLALEQAAVVRPNLDALLCGVAAGFFDRARTLILTEQEEVRIALLEARQAAEAALHVSEERLRTVVSNAPIVLFALDQAGVFTLCMGQALAELGLTASDVVGRSMRDVYRDAPASVEHVRRALQGARFCATTEGAGPFKW